MNLRLGLGFVALVGCSSVTSESTSDPSGSALVGAAPVVTCPRLPKDPDRTRKVVVSHPYAKGAPNLYEVLELTPAGELTRTGVTFELGKSAETAIAFTPDGEIGLVVQDNGKIGVLRFGESATPEIVNAGLGDFYAKAVVMDPTGTRAFAIDPDSVAHAGGVYELMIGCDGTVTPGGHVIGGGGADAMAFIPNRPGRAVLHASEAFTAKEGADTFLLDMFRPEILAKGDAFGDHRAIASSSAVTPDGQYALISDGGINAGNRVAVVKLPEMRSVQVLETEAPFSTVASVYGNAAIIVNGDSVDHISTVRYDRTNPYAPFEMTGRIPYTLPRPQLPGVAVQITRGRLSGRVLVAELLAVRQVQFAPDGTVADVSQTTWSGGIEDIVGTVGVQP